MNYLNDGIICVWIHLAHTCVNSRVLGFGNESAGSIRCTNRTKLLASREGRLFKYIFCAASA